MRTDTVDTEDPDPGEMEDGLLQAAAALVDPPLLAALCQLTGDRSLLADELRPAPGLPFDPSGGWSPATRERAEAVALGALRRWRDAGCPPAPATTMADLRPLMAYVVGHDVSDEYLPLLYEELGGAGDDPRAPGFTVAELDPGRTMRVAVVGAGMSGLLAAHRLRQAGVEVVVLEKDDEVGGTWYENSYPGCRVDVPNHFYSYSFAQRADWRYQFSPRDVILDYFREAADTLGLRDAIRLRTEVRAARFEDASCSWTLEVVGPDGPGTVRADAVVFATGQLNRPQVPAIEGAGTFAGPAFHSARWDHDVDLRGKRVAVIGTGASAVQFVPAVAREAAQLTVFQRTPPWLLSSPEYQAEVPAAKRWSLRHVPTYHHWWRFWLFYRTSDALLPATEVDPGWTEPGSAGPVNALARSFMLDYLQRQFADRPDLLARVVPDYPPFAKRMLFDDGSWATALKRPTVDLVTDPVVRLTPTGVVTATGEHPADVVIYATGFRASDFLSPVTVTGRGGRDLHTWWGGDARAYLGMTVPGFPNLFMLYGPNTNIVVNGSIIFFSECEVRYVLGCLRLLLQGGHGAADVRRDVHDAYNDEVDGGNQARVWGATAVRSWYRNATGRVSQNWPFTLQDFWRRTLAPDPDDYELLPRPPGA